MFFYKFNECLPILPVYCSFRQTWNHVKPGVDTHACSCACNKSRIRDIRSLLRDLTAINIVRAPWRRVVLRCVTLCTATPNQEPPRSSACTHPNLRRMIVAETRCSAPPQSISCSRKYYSESDSRHAIASLREVLSPTDMTARGYEECSAKDVLSK
jgi:hypothetical protein